MEHIKYIHFNGATPKGIAHISGSKSISNRVLVIKALCGTTNPAPPITGMATAKDTQILAQLLHADSSEYDAHDAGTAYRFLTAFLSLRDGKKRLTGTPRMQERPIGPLVEALRQLGANITYEQKEGYPPLLIDSPDSALFQASQTPQIHLDGSTSSQFATALLLIAPTLPHGLHLHLTGNVVSLPYLDMTIRLMQHFGIDIAREAHTFLVKCGQYTPKAFHIEPDWSAASYFYSMIAIAQKGDILLEGLTQNSLQGDAIVAKIYCSLGVATEYLPSGIRIYSAPELQKTILQYDFTHCPDIAQTVIVSCAALGVQGVFTGLESLLIKETNRVLAMKTELAKLGVTFSKLPPHFSKKQPDKTFYLLEGKASMPPEIIFRTYHDHRMAMSLSPLALLSNIGIESPQVVQKSYPEFWDDMERVMQR